MAAAPAGWLKANGATVSRATYADLFAAIGTTYGAGDGATTFRLPDLRGEFLRSWDDGRGVDPGRTVGSSQLATKITGDDGVDGAGAIHGIGDLSQVNCDPGATAAKLYYAPLSAVQTTGASYWGYVRPRNVALLACIKY
jgi:phage-related tail fiber protein